MSYSVNAFHDPGNRCEFKVVELLSPRNREKVMMYLGGVGCGVSGRHGNVVHDISTTSAYGDVRDRLNEFRASHERVDEDAFADHPRGRRLGAMSKFEFTPDPDEERQYQTTVDFLTGVVELPEGVDREMVLQAWTQGVDVDAFAANPDSTIAR
jgi:hypothetical protein